MTGMRDGWRQFRRVIPPSDAPVRVDVESLPGVVLEARDISEGGMELWLAEPEKVELDQVLALILSLPSERPVRATARVRHMDPERIGVVFTELSPGGREAIRRYILRLASQGGWWRRLRRLWQA